MAGMEWVGGSRCLLVSLASPSPLPSPLGGVLVPHLLTGLGQGAPLPQSPLFIWLQVVALPAMV